MLSFQETEIIFSETSEDKLKGKIGFPQIPNLDALITALDQGVTPKELQFFHGGQNREFRENLYCQDLNDSSRKFVYFHQNLKV